MGKKYDVVKSTDRLSFETSFSYWKVINQNLQAYVDILEGEVNKLSEVMPNSQSYWEMKSQLDDSKRIAGTLYAFLYPHIVDACK